MVIVKPDDWAAVKHAVIGSEVGPRYEAKMIETDFRLCLSDRKPMTRRR